MDTRPFSEFCTDAWVLCRRRDPFLQSVGYGFAVAVLYGFETLMQPLLPSLSSYQISFLGTSALLVGLPGSLFGGWVLDATKQYKWMTILLTVLPAVVLVGVMLLSTVADKHFVIVLVLSSITGGLLCAVLSAGFEWAVEVCYPAPESTSAGILNAWANFLGIGFIYGIEALLDVGSCVYGNGVLVLGLVVSCLFFFGVRNVQQRQAAQLYCSSIVQSTLLLSAVEPKM